MATLGVIGGSVAVFGDYVSADAVLPARYGYLPAAEAASHVLEEAEAGANARVRANPILVAGEAFGYGTGRESPARALRAAGVKGLVAASFGRMFYRNALNNGMLPVECGELARAGVAQGDRLEIDTGAALVRWKGREFRIDAVPALLQEIILAGDLIAHGRNILGRR
jgi:3-isopropylmalate/(R)-2-methylmalate dehydratase small subunit